MTPLDPAGHVHAGAGRWPRRPALRLGDRVVTYGELSDAVARAASALRFGRGSLVRIGPSATWDGIVSLLAVHAVGAVPLVVPAPCEPQLIGGGPAAMIVVPTSGSSGLPRSVPLTAENVSATVEASAARLGTDGDDTWLLCLPLHHVAGMAILWRALAAGAAVIPMERFDPHAAAAVMHGRATVASLVPTMLRRVLAAGSTFSGMRAVLVGGGAASSMLIEQGVAAGLPVVATYGMTETASQVATVAPGEIAESMGTVGRPVPGMEVTIGPEGEIIVDGPAVFPGYLDAPPRSGPHVTGDVGHFDGDGRLVVEGRGDDVVVTGGEKVHPSQVEAVLEAHPAVVRAVVFGVPSAEWGMEVVAVVEGAASGDELAVWARPRLAGHQAPKRIVVSPGLPVLASGKVDRGAVRADWRDAG